MPKKRMQSPSSINTYKQCPRKYFYKYIKELPTKSTIQLIRGKIAHSVLEDFFDIDTSNITKKNQDVEFKKKVQELLLKYWHEDKKSIAEFKLNSDQEKFYFSETLLMLFNWLEQFTKKISAFDNLSFQEIFQKLTPIREAEYSSVSLYVHGFIDAIETENGQVHIMDYKTSTNLEVSEEQRVQLGIYSLLYKEKHGKPPNKVGIYFLRHKPKYMNVDDDLLNEAREAIEFVHTNTTHDQMDKYPLKTGPLCKWCDFYSLCFEQKTIPKYQSDVNPQKI